MCCFATGVLGLQPQEYPLITLRGYIVFWGCAFTLLTLAIALWKQETDHYAEAQERKRRRHRRHKRGSSITAAAAGKDGSAGPGAAVGSGSYDDAAGVEWTARRAEIVSAYHKLWGVVSRHTVTQHFFVGDCRQPWLWSAGMLMVVHPAVDVS
jgi:hypothetical protein